MNLVSLLLIYLSLVLIMSLQFGEENKNEILFEFEKSGYRPQKSRLSHGIAS